MFQIGNHIIQGQVLLAPMAGITDQPFRHICQEYGAALTISEMVTSDTRLWSSDKSRSRLKMNTTSSIPNSVQIAGTDPQEMAEAAAQCVDLGADIIDINMGCPAKKVCKKLAGSALLKDETLVANILEAVVNRVNVPVTLKTRTGWDTHHKNGINVAILAEQLGVKAITVHGRTRQCRFNGEAEYDSIAKIAEAVNIPVIANGDIDSAEKAVEVLKYTQAAAVMIGRAAWGNPWIFAHTNKIIDDSQAIYTKPGLFEVQSVIVQHINALHDFYGETKGLRIARKHFAWYCKHLPGAEASIQTFNRIESIEQQLQHIYQYFKHITNYEELAA